MCPPGTQHLRTVGTRDLELHPAGYEKGGGIEHFAAPPRFPEIDRTVVETHASIGDTAGALLNERTATVPRETPAPIERDSKDRVMADLTDGGARTVRSAVLAAAGLPSTPVSQTPEAPGLDAVSATESLETLGIHLATPEGRRTVIRLMVDLGVAVNTQDMSKNIEALAKRMMELETDARAELVAKATTNTFTATSQTNDAPDNKPPQTLRTAPRRGRWRR